MHFDLRFGTTLETIAVRRKLKELLDDYDRWEDAAPTLRPRMDFEILGMRTSVHKAKVSIATDVRFSKERLWVGLKDGREISVPLEWFPRLKHASPKERQNRRLVGRGIGIHWPDLDEDIFVSALLK
jgi:hypothetical protein